MKQSMQEYQSGNLPKSLPARRRGRPKKQDPGTGSYPEHAFTPSRATEIESYPLPDFPLAHDQKGPDATDFAVHRPRKGSTVLNRRTVTKQSEFSEQDAEEEQRERESAKGLHGWVSEVEEFGNTIAANERERFQCISVIGQIEGPSFLLEGQKAST